MSENKQIHEALQSFTLPTYSEIPDVGLYLDQVTKYINSFMTGFPEMEVTPSMISNYAKQKLIDRVNKKRYTRDQIATLIMIAMTKTVLSIDNVRTLINDINSTGTPTKEVYTSFRSLMHEVLATFREPDLSLRMDGIESELDRTTRNVIITVAHKMYLERYFEYRHESETDDEESEEKPQE